MVDSLSEWIIRGPFLAHLGAIFSFLTGLEPSLLDSLTDSLLSIAVRVLYSFSGESRFGD